jgi:hypothetical protein
VGTKLRGACLCGAVTFAVAPPYRWFAYCHCSMCRKHHGSLFGTSLGVARAAFRWLAGEDAIVHYRATAAFERPFCRHCGSAVPAVAHDERYWHVPAGLLDGDVGARPRAHIFTASRSPLVELDDTLKRHDAYPAGIALPAIELQREHDASAVVAGSCLCGAVYFAATAMPRRLVNCHCSLCRRSRAAAFSSTLIVPRDAFRWSRGEARVRSYALPETAMGGGSRATQGAAAGSNVRPPRNYAADFCEGCGSLVPSAAPGSASAMLPAGAIDTALPPLPAVHLYVASKAPWHDIVDGWPQFQELPPPEQLTEVFQ